MKFVALCQKVTNSNCEPAKQIWVEKWMRKIKLPFRKNNVEQLFSKRLAFFLVELQGANSKKERHVILSYPQV